MEYENLIACHECDALFRKPRLQDKSSAHCLRCGATLYRSVSRRLDCICALTLAALFTFVIAQGFPILELQTAGIVSRTSLFGALVALWNEDMRIVAAMVFCSTVLFPLTELVALLYVLIPIRRSYVPPGFNGVLRAIQFVRPWGMIEVFMLGVLITIVKMVSLARVIPEAALFAFGALTLLFVVVLTFDPRSLWDIADEIEARRAVHRPRGECAASTARPAAHSTSMSTTTKWLTASRAGLCACHACGRMARGVALRHAQHCARCGATLHRRNPDSLTRTWALLLSAVLLYIPANLLPVMHTSSLAGSEDDTIMSGVVYFWTSGSWPLAIVVFIASILVPMLKLSVLVLLTATAQRRSAWRPVERVKLYRIVERIGRWSMLDVFVVTLTVALVRFESLAVITAGPGALAFGCVVILTMLASMQFDSRLIWDYVMSDSKDTPGHTPEPTHE